MRIKKFVAESVQQALENIKVELGPDAIILSIQEITAAKGGRKKRPRVEVTAAVDEEVRTSVGQPAKRTVAYSETPASPSNSTGENGILQLQRELTDLRQQLTQIAQLKNHLRIPTEFLETYLTLLNQGVNEEVAQDFVRRLQSQKQVDGQPGNSFIRRQVLEELQQIIVTAESPWQVQETPYVIALIGPTGVGKTTTIAKLAAADKVFHNRKVGLISTDTYRIAAVEQLQTFANIAQLPLKVVYTAEEMQFALFELREMDRVYIDTPGRSQRNEEGLKELQVFLQRAHPHETHLVLSLTTKEIDLHDIVKRFSVIPINRILFTKLDETTNYGTILSLIKHFKQPVSYLTFGQNVPEDIRKADTSFIARLILGMECI